MPFSPVPIAWLCPHGHSAKESAIWYFGQNAGLDFNYQPVRVLTDGQVNTDEGSASISNSNGELLFYSDSSTVWNKQHNVMRNGTGLYGNSSSTQSAVIIPCPENANLYYLFTVNYVAKDAVSIG